LRPPRRTIALITTAVLSLALLAGCATADWTTPHEAPAALGVAGAGFFPSSPPSPEATVNPAAGSWDDVRPSAGMRVVLLTAGAEAPTTTLAAAVKEWADDEDVDLRTVVAGDNHIDAIVEAMDMKPDLIITVGNDIIDALATVTASHLDQNFLVLGAEVAEPTYNVTAVDWSGASFRGLGLVASSTFDPATFTPERSAAAVRAGVASVLLDQTGVVLWID